MMMTRHAGGSKGFSLVELLVAVTVLTVGLFAVATMQSVAISNTAISHRMMVATELAKEAMEDITAWDIAKPELNSSVSGAPYANVEVSGAIFSITYSTTVNTPAPGTTRIDVTVTEVSPLHAINPVLLTSYTRVI